MKQHHENARARICAVLGDRQRRLRWRRQHRPARRRRRPDHPAAPRSATTWATSSSTRRTSDTPAAQRLVKLSPPTADGKQTTICCDQAGPEFANIDISGYDISFDAKQIVFAGKLAANQRYGLFLLTLADGNVEQLPTDPVATTSRRSSSPATRSCSPRTRSSSPARRSTSTSTSAAPRCSSAASTPTARARSSARATSRTARSRRCVSDGRVMFTQWDHLGPMNAGHLMFVNQDMQELREAFGKEGTGASNSTLKAQEISPGPLRRDRDRRATARSRPAR